MKSLVVAIVLIMFVTTPVLAQDTATSSAVMGLYDEDLTSTNSASLSATPTPAATPSARATTYLDPSTAPVSGTTENTIVMLCLGLMFITLGVFYSRHQGV